MSPAKIRSRKAPNFNDIFTRFDELGQSWLEGNVKTPTGWVYVYCRWGDTRYEMFHAGREYSTTEGRTGTKRQLSARAHKFARAVHAMANTEQPRLIP